MRTKNSIRNSTVSVICYASIMLGSFITRGVFARAMGDQLVGVEALFLNIVNMLSIVELGIGTGIVYKLYKPLAEHDDHKIAVLVNFFKNAYIKISWILFGLGLAGAFVAPYFVTNGEFNHWWLSFIFLFYVGDVLSSYLYAHKRALFMADQKNHILVLYHTVGQVTMCVLQVIMLLVFHSFVGYLIIKISCRVFENVLISRHYKKYYSYIDLHTKDKLPTEERKNLFSNIKALLFHQIGGFTMSSSASIITSLFVNLETVGYYSNYMMITNGIIVLTIHFFDGIVASFGDLVVRAKKEEVYDTFRAIQFVNYLIISFCAVSLFVLGKPFVKLWIGSANAAFPIVTLGLIVVLFFIMGMRQSVLMVRNSAGIYRPDRYFPLLEATINISMSLILVQFWGVNGIVFANILSLFCVPFWTQPIIIHKYVLHANPVNYFIRYAAYFSVTAALAIGTYYLADLIVPFTGILELLCKAFICLIVPNVLNLLIFSRTRQFVYIRGLFQELVVDRFLKKQGV